MKRINKKYWFGGGVGFVVVLIALMVIKLRSGPTEPKAFVPAQQLVDLRDPVDMKRQPLSAAITNIVPFARLGVGRMQTFVPTYGQGKELLNAHRRFVPFVNGNMVTLVDSNNGQSGLSFTGFERIVDPDESDVDRGEVIAVGNGGDVMLVPTKGESAKTANDLTDTPPPDTKNIPTVVAVRKDGVIQLRCAGNGQTDSYAIHPDGGQALIWTTKKKTNGNRACLVDTRSGRTIRNEKFNGDSEPLRGYFVSDGQFRTIRISSPSIYIDNGEMSVSEVSIYNDSRNLAAPNELFNAADINEQGFIVAASKLALWTKPFNAAWRTVPIAVNDEIVQRIRVSPDGSRALLEIARPDGQESPSRAVKAILFVDTTNGAVLWATPEWSTDERFSFTFAKHVLLVQPAAGQAFAISYETGKVLWRADSGLAPWAEARSDALACFQLTANKANFDAWGKDCTEPLAKREKPIKTQVQVDPNGLRVFQGERMYLLETDLNVTVAAISEDTSSVFFATGGQVFKWDFATQAPPASVSTADNPSSLVESISIQRSDIAIARSNGSIEFFDGTLKKYANLNYADKPIRRPDLAAITAVSTPDHRHAILTLVEPTALRRHNDSAVPALGLAFVVDLTRNELITNRDLNSDPNSGIMIEAATPSVDGNTLAVWVRDPMQGNVVFAGSNNNDTKNLDGQIVNVVAQDNGFVIELVKESDGQTEFLQFLDGALTPTIGTPLEQSTTQPTTPEASEANLSAQSTDGSLSVTVQPGGSRITINDKSAVAPIEVFLDNLEPPANDTGSADWPRYTTVVSIAVINDGARIVATGSGSVWLLGRKGRLLTRAQQFDVKRGLSWDPEVPANLTVSPSGRVVVVNVNGNAVLYDTNKLRALAKFSVNPTDVLEFSDDESLLLTDTTVYAATNN